MQVKEKFCRTKIICTLGPACDNEETLKGLIKEGLDGARFNFSHGMSIKKELNVLEK